MLLIRCYYLSSFALGLVDCNPFISFFKQVLVVYKCFFVETALPTMHRHDVSLKKANVGYSPFSPHAYCR